MTPRPLFALLCLLALPLAAQPPDDGVPSGKIAIPKQETIDLSTPQQTVRSLVAAANRFDFPAASRCVEGGKAENTAVLNSLAAEWKKSGVQIYLGEARVRRMGEIAIVTIPMAMQRIIDSAAQPPQSERVLLRRSEDLWKVVGNPKMTPMGGKKPPETPDTPPGLEPGNGFLTMIATFLANPQVLQQARGDAQRAACQSNLKQLALAAFLLAQDKKNTFNFTLAPGTAPAPESLKAAWQKAIYAYAKTEQLFICPLLFAQAEEQTNNDPKLKNQAQNLGARAIFPAEAYESYAFNAALENLRLDQIPEPAATVLLYEGKEGKLDFRHDGKANVAFADGHVETIGPDDVKKLIWTPKGKQQ
jgi:prepilin-type processing-associated H-X9-DG protein